MAGPAPGGDSRRDRQQAAEGRVGHDAVAHESTDRVPDEQLILAIGESH